MKVSEKAIASLNVEIPSPWLVRRKASEHDTDNLYLLNNAKAAYKLVNLVVFGHCIELKNGRAL